MDLRKLVLSAITSMMSSQVRMSQIQPFDYKPAKGQKRSAPRKPSGAAALKRAAKKRANIRARSSK